jgi:hypothetical protein
LECPIASANLCARRFDGRNERRSQSDQREVWAELKEEGRIVDHPVFSGKAGPGARRIDDDADVDDVIALLRLNYDRLARRGGGAPRARAAR